MQRRRMKMAGGRWWDVRIDPIWQRRWHDSLDYFVRAFGWHSCHGEVGIISATGSGRDHWNVVIVLRKKKSGKFFQSQIFFLPYRHIDCTPCSDTRDYWSWLIRDLVRRKELRPLLPPDYMSHPCECSDFQRETGVVDCRVDRALTETAYLSATSIRRHYYLDCVYYR